MNRVLLIREGRIFLETAIDEKTMRFQTNERGNLIPTKTIVDPNDLSHFGTYQIYKEGDLKDPRFRRSYWKSALAGVLLEEADYGFIEPPERTRISEGKKKGTFVHLGIVSLFRKRSNSK